MKHKDEIIEKPRDPETDFVTIETHLCIVPIIKDEKKFPESIVGTGFLVEYNGLSYIITVKHVIKDLSDPIIMFSDKKLSLMPIGISVLNNFEIDWVDHPKGLDLVAIPIILPKSIDKLIGNRHFQIKKIVKPEYIKPNSSVKHMGFGGKRTGRNKKTKKPMATPAGIFGRFISYDDKEILIYSSAEDGDSGGPLFVKESSKTGALIGIIRTTSKSTKITNPQDGEYTGSTTAIPISHIYEILESKKMKTQLVIGKQRVKELNDRMLD